MHVPHAHTLSYKATTLLALSRRLMSLIKLTHRASVRMIIFSSGQFGIYTDADDVVPREAASYHVAARAWLHCLHTCESHKEWDPQ